MTDRRDVTDIIRAVVETDGLNDDTRREIRDLAYMRGVSRDAALAYAAVHAQVVSERREATDHEALVLSGLSAALIEMPVGRGRRIGFGSRD